MTPIGHFENGRWIEDTGALLETPWEELVSIAANPLYYTQTIDGHGNVRQIIEGLFRSPLTIDYNDPRASDALRRLEKARWEATVRKMGVR